jgi:DNA-directed RNA polymerase III subunit RPC4
MTQDEELDSDDEAMMAALSTRSASVMPMGIYRKEHKEAEVVVATTAELEAKENATGAVEESLWVDGESGSLPPVDQPEEGVWDTGSKAPVPIKAEPGTEDDVMDLDPTSTATPTPVPESKPEAKPEGKVVKVRKALSEDPESKMIQSDLDLLAKELGGVSVEKNGESTAEMSNKEGRLYLFQFPPLMPPLRQTGEAQPPIKVKDEDTKETNVEDIPASADGLAVDLTQDDAAKEEDDTTAEEERKQAELKGGFRKQLLSQGGMIGRVNVRKSGKVELNWGGQILEMSPAAGMNFLTTAAILEESDEKPKTNSDGGPPTGGDCVGMGKIMGRFTLAPVWSEEEDWHVAPGELETA